MNKTQAASLFKPSELNKAKVIIKETQTRPLRRSQRLMNEIVVPVMDRINKDTGQENDPAFMAYVLEYAVT